MLSARAKAQRHCGEGQIGVELDVQRTGPSRTTTARRARGRGEGYWHCAKTPTEAQDGRKAPVASKVPKSPRQPPCAPMSPALRRSQRTQDSAITFESIRALPIAEPSAGREPGSAFMQIGIPAPAVALRLIPPWRDSEKEQGGRYSGSHYATRTASIRLLITSIRSLIDGSRVSAHSARTYSRPRRNAPIPWA